ARCKRVSTGCGRTRRSGPAWPWICGVKPKPKAGNKPWQPCIVHGLDKPGVFTTVSFIGNSVYSVAAESLNVSPFVARQIWRRRRVLPRLGRAALLQRREPLRGLLVPMAPTYDLLQTASSTVSEQSLLYIQRCQEVALFPMIQASKLIALQTPGRFMPH